MDERLRWFLYTAIQKVRKEPVIEVLRFLRTSQWLSRKELERVQLARLRDLLQFGKRNVPFYRERIKEINAENQIWESFRQIKPIDRNDIQKNRQLMIAENIRIPYNIARTAGSTGISLILPVSNLSWAYHHANILRILEWHGIHPFEKQARIWGRAVDFETRVKTFIKDFLLNRVRLSVFALSKESCRQFYCRIVNSKASYLYGYATALAEFSRILESMNLSGKRLSLKAIVNTAEVLDEKDRNFLEDFFKSRVVNIYGSAEVGIIAGECPHGKMHIPVESIVLETVEEDRKEKAGSRVLVTDLNNYKMPIIRYELGDLVTCDGNAICGCGRELPVLEKIWGRLASVFDFDGKKIHSALFNYIIKSVFHEPDRLKGFLVVREKERHFSVHLHTLPPPSKEEVGKIKELFESYLAKDILVSFNITTDIPRNIHSGKVDTFLDEYSFPQSRNGF